MKTKIISKTPRKAAVKIDMSITRNVKTAACLFVGQETCDISNLVSLI